MKTTTATATIKCPPIKAFAFLCARFYSCLCPQPAGLRLLFATADACWLVCASVRVCVCLQPPSPSPPVIIVPIPSANRCLPFKSVLRILCASLLVLCIIECDDRVFFSYVLWYCFWPLLNTTAPFINPNWPLTLYLWNPHQMCVRLGVCVCVHFLKNIEEREKKRNTSK